RRYYLDSEADYDSPTNLAVLIDYDHAPAFKAKGIDNPAEHYKGKRIRVTGTVIREEDQTRIRVTDPARIEVVAGSKP
ncbi:MAG: hypothetical protein K2X91_07315, partial [Thermoleophilia bacterium]|nr:hypothetical protein [Thermoleophilia bacterium]